MGPSCVALAAPWPTESANPSFPNVPVEPENPLIGFSLVRDFDVEIVHVIAWCYLTTFASRISDFLQVRKPLPRWNLLCACPSRIYADTLPVRQLPLHLVKWWVLSFSLLTGNRTNHDSCPKIWTSNILSRFLGSQQVFNRLAKLPKWFILLSSSNSGVCKIAVLHMQYSESLLNMSH